MKKCTMEKVKLAKYSSLHQWTSLYQVA